MRTLLLLCLLSFGCRTEVKPEDSGTSPDDTAPSCTDADQDGFCEDEDCDDADASIHPGADEVCDGVDNDCDELLDDQDPDCALDDVCMYPDADGDGYGDETSCEAFCDLPSGYTYDGEDCDDGDASIHPDADEVCDGVDQDCDGEIDEDAIDATDGWQDLDGAGYGGDFAAHACEHHSAVVDNGEDCDDADAAVNPGMDEDPCNEVDDDCDGEVDEWGATVEPDAWYADADADGYGDPADVVMELPECDPPEGYVSNDQDCDDTDPEVNPSGYETCNGYDDDCDFLVDDEDPDCPLDAVCMYPDADGDGYGDETSCEAFCDLPSGYTYNGQDCDDGDASINPSADEYCDGVDNDCNGTVDDSYALDATTWYADDDRDGYGDAADATDACEAGSGHVTDDNDCDDTDATVNPGADEYCNGVDDDCNGTVDDNTPWTPWISTRTTTRTATAAPWRAAGARWSRPSSSTTPTATTPTTPTTRSTQGPTSTATAKTTTATAPSTRTTSWWTGWAGTRTSTWTATATRPPSGSPAMATRTRCWTAPTATTPTTT